MSDRAVRGSSRLYKDPGATHVTSGDYTNSPWIGEELTQGTCPDPSDAVSDNDSVKPHVGDETSGHLTPSLIASPSGRNHAPPEAEPTAPSQASGTAHRRRSHSSRAISRPPLSPRTASHKRPQSGSHTDDAEEVRRTQPPAKVRNSRGAPPADPDPPLSRTERAGRGASRATRNDTRPARATQAKNRSQKRSQVEPPAAASASAPRAQPVPAAGDATRGAPAPANEGPSDAAHPPDDGAPTILLQPETKPISHGQLVVEVRGIYAGLVMVEAKCIDVDKKQAAAARDLESSKNTKLSSEQWRALIALHKTLLNEHHDFFLASQHPAASPMLSGLAKKYAMPARLWRHAIYGFLEVLRLRLPDSQDQMLAFIYIAYAMMALLYETALEFSSIWIEALGDLSRYRFAIESEDQEVRQTWSNVSRSWYLKATDKDPTIGRLQHHIAILEKPFSVRQLSKFAVSLTCIVPFPGSKISIMSLLIPVLEDRPSVRSRTDPVQFNFIKVHAIICTSRQLEALPGCVSTLIDGNLLAKHIKREKDTFKELGAAMALANTAAMLGYGQSTADGVPLGILRLVIEQQNYPNIAAESAADSQEDQQEQRFSIDSLTPAQMALGRSKLSYAATFSFKLFSAVLRLGPDRNTSPFVHIYLAFLRYLAIKTPQAMAEIQDYVPWDDLEEYLNQTIKSATFKLSRLTKNIMPAAERGSKDRPLMEDYYMRGLMFTQDYPPAALFNNQDGRDEDRLVEQPSLNMWRVERILWLAQKIASLRIWMTFNEKTMKFASTGFSEHAKAFRTQGSESADQDSEMTELGSDFDPEARTLVDNSSSVVDDGMNQQGRDGSHAVARAEAQRDKEDVEMIDATQTAAAARSQPVAENWLEMSSVDPNTPAKFELSGINPENYPIRIQDGGDESEP